MDNLEINEGLTDEQVAQLVKYTNSDPDIQKYTSDNTRFKSAEIYKNWLKKIEPTVYSLVDPNRNLVGIGWFSRKKFPRAKLTKEINTDNYPFTNGVRIYGDARGKGLGSWFYKFILDKCPANTWNMISVENIPSIKLHQKMGFIQVSETDKNDKIIMVKKKGMLK